MVIKRNTVITSAAAQARDTQLSKAELAYVKIDTVREATGSFISNDNVFLLKEVNNNGAVSPAILATAKDTPVNIPVNALLITISFITL